MSQKFYCASFGSSSISFLSSAGSFTVPNLTIPSGTPYLWPGLQTSNSVLQPVLDGRNNHWYYGNAYVGGAGGPYGGGQSVNPNQKLGYSMTKAADGNSFTIVSSTDSNSVSYTYDIAVQMIDANFCIETYDIPDWTYGSLVFNDVTIVAEGTDFSWCADNRVGRQSGVTADFVNLQGSVNGANSQCHFDQLTLTPP